MSGTRMGVESYFHNTSIILIMILLVPNSYSDYETVDSSSKEKRRVRRFVLHDTRWQKNDFTWRYDSERETRHLPRKIVRETLQKAFNLWSEVADIRFRETKYKTPDIWIRFYSPREPETYPFDGPSGYLANAFYPTNIDQHKQKAGDIDLDDAEMWTVGSDEGKHLLGILAHEIGHSLGIAHSDVRDAVMSRYYAEHMKYREDFRLHDDDVRAVQAYYGRAWRKWPSLDEIWNIERKCDDRRLDCGALNGMGFCLNPMFSELMMRDCCQTCQPQSTTTTATTAVTVRTSPKRDTSARTVYPITISDRGQTTTTSLSTAAMPTSTKFTPITKAATPASTKDTTMKSNSSLRKTSYSTTTPTPDLSASTSKTVKPNRGVTTVITTLKQKKLTGITIDPFSSPRTKFIPTSKAGKNLDLNTLEIFTVGPTNIGTSTLKRIRTTKMSKNGKHATKYESTVATHSLSTTTIPEWFTPGIVPTFPRRKSQSSTVIAKNTRVPKSDNSTKLKTPGSSSRPANLKTTSASPESETSTTTSATITFAGGSRDLKKTTSQIWVMVFSCFLRSLFDLFLHFML